MFIEDCCCARCLDHAIGRERRLKAKRYRDLRMVSHSAARQEWHFDRRLSDIIVKAMADSLFYHDPTAPKPIGGLAALVENNV